ncbi:glycoside hydrolase family 5 protein [Aulographum hederae CBS 113979]|uniref:cellulase n=1 Tax=Aulographum hederae CBS 113979 TaxID=1176131 RepID=A0A6G1H798_9PEZI|nr:glycoside hydrolase family 5 protein [Aulographum hederae CBS 113979]
MKDYVWPNLTTIDTFIAKGMNSFRINVLMERMTEGSMSAPFNKAYMKNMTETIEYITNRGAYAMFNPHNYGRFNEEIITDVDGFKDWWKRVASQYVNNTKVMFDTMNEFHTMDQSLVVKLNQAAIDGIRAAGATSQWITPEGNAWSGAWSWTKSSENGATMGSLTDPSNKLIYQMHQYLDTDSSGTKAECASATIGEERLVDATNWLREQKKVALIGEYAAADNPTCKQAVDGMMKYMVKNSDVWKGAMWWAAGPWWGKQYFANMEPTDGDAFRYALPGLTAAANIAV